MNTPAGRAATLLVLLAAAVSPTVAGRLPEWARPIAAAAPSIEGPPSKHLSRVLYREVRVAVDAQGRMRERRRIALQALSARANEIGLGFFAFRDGAKILVSKGWHVPPGKRAERGYGPPLDLAVGNAFLSDSRARLVALEGARRGSLVFFEFEAEDTPPSLAFRDLIFENAPIGDVRFEAEVPAGWTVHHAWLRTPGAIPTVEGNVHRWELHDVPVPDEEPDADLPAERAPILYVTFEPPREFAPAVPWFADWAAVSRWYETLAQGRDAVTPALASAAEQADQDAGDDPGRKIALLAAFVRDRVRYVSKEIGIGGYQPRPAAEILTDLNGDCKDKGTLLRSLLAAEGLESYPIIVNATHKATVSDEIPTLDAFNHYVLGVRLPYGAAVPPQAKGALLDAGDLGHLVVVDTTNEASSFGSLCADLAGKRALLVAGDRGRIVTLPEAQASFHVVERHLEFERATAEGGWRVRMSSRLTGEPAEEARSEYRRSPSDRRREIERRAFAMWTGAVVDDYSVESETSAGQFLETVALLVPVRPTSTPSDGIALRFFPGSEAEFHTVPLGRRKVAVDLTYPRTIRWETTMEVPAGIQPPDAESLHGDGWSVSSSYAREGTEIHGRYEVVLDRARFEPEAFAELKRFWSAVSKAASGIVVVER